MLGDLNSRTGKLNEYIETNHFLLNELHLDELEDVVDDEFSYFEKSNISTQFQMKIQIITDISLLTSVNQTVFTCLMVG